MIIFQKATTVRRSTILPRRIVRSDILKLGRQKRHAIESLLPLFVPPLLPLLHFLGIARPAPLALQFLRWTIKRIFATNVFLLVRTRW